MPPITWTSTVRAVMRKELCEILRNRTLLVSLVAPVLLAVFFVKAMERFHAAPLVRLAMLAGSDARLRTVLALTGAFEVRDFESESLARAGVEQGNCEAAVLLAGDFDQRLRRGDSPRVTLVVRRDATPQTASAVSALTEILRLRAGQKSPVALSLEAVGRDEGFVRRGRLLVGFVLFVLLMGFGLVATSVVEEREQATLEAISVTGVRLDAVLFGKAFTIWLLILACGLAMIGLCGALHPPYVGLLTILGVGAAFAVCLGQWMGTLFPNIAAANAGLPVVFLALFLPAVMQEQLHWRWIEWLPGNYLMRALQGILVSGDGVAWGTTVGIAVYAAACAAAAWWTLIQRKGALRSC